MGTTKIGAGETRQVVALSLAGQEFGVPIGSVQEIICYQPPRPVPGSHADLEGVINLRGRLIPVIALGPRLGAVGARHDDAKTVVVEVSAGTVGIVVDGVTEVLMVEADDIEPLPGATEGNADYVEAVAKLEGRLLVLLDLDRLLADAAL